MLDRYTNSNLVYSVQIVSNGVLTGTCPCTKNVMLDVTDKFGGEGGGGEKNGHV